MKSSLLRELSSLFFLEADDSADDREANRLILIGEELAMRSLAAVKVERNAGKTGPLFTRAPA